MEFLKGTIEAVPLPAGSVDVVISNCVVNLSADKPAVLAEMFRVLVPGGRIGVSDVVAEDHLTPAERAERGSWVGCIAGALSRSEYLAGWPRPGSPTPPSSSPPRPRPACTARSSGPRKPTPPAGEAMAARRRRSRRRPAVAAESATAACC